MIVLHLSDLHFGAGDNPQLYIGPLVDDLRGPELNCRSIDAIVLSGDLTRTAAPGEFKVAKDFCGLLTDHFKLRPQQWIICPGNHDLDWERSKEAYRLIRQEDYRPPKKIHASETGPRAERIIDRGNGVLEVRQGDYPERFSAFADFYRDVTGRVYPLDHAAQGTLHPFSEHGLLFLGLNSSAWIDHHFKDRASIDPEALERALEGVRCLPDASRCPIRVAVWHHPLQSEKNDHIKEHAFLERLYVNGFRLALHGHLHKSSSGHVDYYHHAHHGITVLGAGTFGAPCTDWPAGVPQSYHVLDSGTPNGTSALVRTRQRGNVGGAWESAPIWRTEPGKEKVSWLPIDLATNPSSSTPAGDSPPVSPVPTGATCATSSSRPTADPLECPAPAPKLARPAPSQDPSKGPVPAPKQKHNKAILLVSSLAAVMALLLWSPWEKAIRDEGSGLSGHSGHEVTPTPPTRTFPQVLPPTPTLEPAYPCDESIPSRPAPVVLYYHDSTKGGVEVPKLSSDPEVLRAFDARVVLELVKYEVAAILLDLSYDGPPLRDSGRGGGHAQRAAADEEIGYGTEALLAALRSANKAGVQVFAAQGGGSPSIPNCSTLLPEDPPGACFTAILPAGLEQRDQRANTRLPEVDKTITCKGIEPTFAYKAATLLCRQGLESSDTAACLPACSGEPMTLCPVSKSALERGCEIHGIEWLFGGHPYSGPDPVKARQGAGEGTVSATQASVPRGPDSGGPRSLKGRVVLVGDPRAGEGTRPDWVYLYVPGTEQKILAGGAEAQAILALRLLARFGPTN